MKKLDMTGASFDPWGMLLVIGLQLDFVLLMTTLWAWPFSSFQATLLSALIQLKHHHLFYEDLTMFGR